MHNFVRILALLPITLSALHKDPWFHNAFEVDFTTSFDYSWFSKVQGASRQLSSSLHDRDLCFDLGLTPLPLFDVRFEGEFAKVESINWALRSGALQTRIGILDDIAGDPMSLTLGLNVRAATGHFLKTVATPYASELNFELTGAIGKEWSNKTVWLSRVYGLVTLGQANRGSPWTSALAAYQVNVKNRHRFTLFADGLVGWGGKKHVDVNHFRGWAEFQYRAIDLGAGYGYRAGSYGELSIHYSYRVFARTYPENVNSLMVAYTVPFSPF